MERQAYSLHLCILEIYRPDKEDHKHTTKINQLTAYPLRLIVALAMLILMSFDQVSAQPDHPPLTDTTLNYVTFRTDREAKEAVLKIVSYSGLTPNFVVRQEDVKNAVAYNKNRTRYIGYNPAFIAKVQNSTNTDWAAVSILAHEIGHHLLGHTLKFKHNPGDELAADKYSGFILYQMGASLDEARAAMKVAGNETGTDKHPPKEARLQAITDGWVGAQELDGRVALDDSSFFRKADERFKMQLTFKGDDNLYLVTEENEVVWYNNYARPIMIGRLSSSNDQNYLWQYHYRNATYGIDSQGNVWNPTTYGTVFKVGRAEKLVFAPE